MHDNNETLWAWLKVALAWLGTIIGGITLSKLVLFATLLLTSMQAYVVWRDKIMRNDSGGDRGELR